MTVYYFIFFSWLGLILHLAPDASILSVLIGFCSYSALALLLAFLDSKLSWKARSVYYLVIFAVVVLEVEHILINGAHLDLALAGLALDRKFAFATLLNLRIAVICFFVMTLFVSALAITSRIKFSVPLKVFLSMVLVLNSIDLLVPAKVQYSSWFQKNPLTYNLRNVFRATGDQDIGESEHFRTDLSGDLLPDVIIQKGAHRNVIVLVLEGFSGDYFARGLAPEIKQIFDENFSVPHFLTNQVQTNRGLYALFCGDYPNIGHAEAKPDLISTFGPRRPCLPEILKEAGMRPVFMQSAPLEFMRKDLFAKAAGFDYAAGAGSYEPEKSISNWGIGDNTLLEGSLNVLRDETLAGPIFLSLLTVGTHHPYITPESKNDLKAAIRYTDKIVGEYYRMLKAGGHMDNTLLIITTDEARPVERADSLVLSHWGLLGIVGPGVPKKTKNLELFSQVDLAISIADYLGLSEVSKFRGRSVFRRYEQDRKIFAGSAFLRRPMMFENSRTFHVCDEGYSCVEVRHKKSFFDQTERPEVFPSNKASVIQAFVNQSDILFSQAESDLLFSEKDFMVREIVGVLGDFKTPPEFPRLEYRIAVDPGRSAMDTNLELKVQIYPCGDTSKMHDFVAKGPANKDFSLLIEMPESIRGKTACHGAVLTGPQVFIERFELRRAREEVR